MVKELDTGLLLFMQREFGESSRLIWDTITTFGNPAVIVCVIALVLWFKGSRPALLLLATCLLGGIVVDLLKVIIAQPRPYYELLEVAAWRNSDGFGMPSGHAAGAVTLWGLLAVLFKRQWLWLFALLAMLLIGLSRVYFAVHSPSQVVSGWLIGVLVVWLVVRFEPLFSRWFCAIGLCRQLVLALLTTTLLFSFQQSVISRWAAEFQVPEVWEQRYLEASESIALFKGESLESERLDSQAGLVLFKAFDHTQTGVFLGVWLLAICIAKYGGFSPGSVKESGLIALFSLILIGVSLPVLTNLQGIGLLEIFVWSAVPWIIGLGLPRLLQKLLKL